MLAPRKTLWSTPVEVIDTVIASLKVQATDVVYDIGCGDGRFVLRCHEATGARCIGVEIDDARADDAAAAVAAKATLGGQCTIIKGNALEQDYTSGTVFFLYLVPRGLKIILPLLQVHARAEPDMTQPDSLSSLLPPFPPLPPLPPLPHLPPLPPSPPRPSAMRSGCRGPSAWPRI